MQCIIILIWEARESRIILVYLRNKKYNIPISLPLLSAILKKLHVIYIFYLITIVLTHWLINSKSIYFVCF